MEQVLTMTPCPFKLKVFDKFIPLNCHQQNEGTMTIYCFCIFYPAHPPLIQPNILYSMQFPCNPVIEYMRFTIFISYLQHALLCLI